MMRLLAAALGGLIVFAPGIAYAEANIQNIRIARHPDHIRVVLDLDAPVSFESDGHGGFELQGLVSGSAVMNAGAHDAPLNRVILSPDGDKTKLSFDTKAPVKSQAFLLPPDSKSGHRLVVDLSPNTPPAASASASPPDAPAPAIPQTGTVHGAPAVASTAVVKPVVSVPPANSYSAVPPSMPIEASSPALEPPANLFTKPNTTASAAPVVPLAEPPRPLPQVPAPGEDRVQFGERALDRGDAPAACRAADEALRATPGDLRALVVLGACRLAQGDPLAARAAFVTALESDPSYHRARIGLAEAEAKLGNIENARTSYARVLADSPPTDETYKIIGALEALDRQRPASAPRHGG